MAFFSFGADFLTYRNDILPNVTSEEISGLLPHTEYDVRLIASNKAGRGPPGTVRKAKTFKPGKSYHDTCYRAFQL